MDLLDELADSLKLAPDLLIGLRKQYGGQTHYIASARPMIREQIARAEGSPLAIARRFGIHRNSVCRIRRLNG